MAVSFLALLLTGALNWDFETSQSYISTILEASDGTMWCATAGGVVHYDPASGWLDSLVYPDGLPWLGASDILISDSQFWVATSGGGLALWQNGQWELFSVYEGIPGSGYVYSVTEAGDYIWVGTDGGLARGDAQGFIPIDEDLTGGVFRADEVTDLQDVGNDLFMATNRGVYSLDLSGSVFDPGSWTSYEDSTIGLGIQGIYAVSSDSVFGYGSGGVSLFSEGSWNRILDYSSSADSVVNGLLMTQDGLLAAARVVICYDGSDWLHYGSDYPVESYASCIQEVSGRIWCGYGLRSSNCMDTGRGLGYLDDGTWDQLRVPGMGCPSCYQIAIDGDRFYLGSHRLGLMAYYPEGGWLEFNKYTVNMPNTLRNYSVAKSGSMGIWTSCYHWGLTWIDDRETYSLEDDTVITYVSDSLVVPPDVVQIVSPLLNNQVVMLTSQSGDLWVAQEAFWQTPDEPSGIVAVSGEPESGDLLWTTRTESDGLASKNIRNLFACGDDSLWIAFASENGCQLLVHGGSPSDKSNDQWYPSAGQAYTTSDGLPSNQVLCFTRDSEGVVWLGTGNGVCRWNGSIFVPVDGLYGSVKAIQVDGQDVVWCMTGDGIFSIDGSDITHYSSSNSIYVPTDRSENEFSTYDPASGTVYFSSLMGLWSIRNDHDQVQSSQLMFYPQPFLPSEEDLHMVWSGEDRNLEAGIFSVSGEYLGSVEAQSWEEWSWDGTLDGSHLASGVYFVVVRSGNETVTSKIALVR